MQLWYEARDRFIRNASEHGTYNQKLAKLLAPEFTQDVAAVPGAKCSNLEISNIAPRCGTIQEAVPEEKHNAIAGEMIPSEPCAGKQWKLPFTVAPYTK
ncbi:MAG: hypothetical protein J6B95_08455 [Oscillospiraceae bacterium]|nr:hypothetical protein [Oscillospiraceae bacterium]